MLVIFWLALDHSFMAEYVRSCSQSQAYRFMEEYVRSCSQSHSQAEAQLWAHYFYCLFSISVHGEGDRRPEGNRR